MFEKCFIRVLQRFYLARGCCLGFRVLSLQGLYPKPESLNPEKAANSLYLNPELAPQRLLNGVDFGRFLGPTCGFIGEGPQIQNPKP